MKKYILGFALAFTLIITGAHRINRLQTVKTRYVMGSQGDRFRAGKRWSVSNGRKKLDPMKLAPDSNESDFIYVLRDDCLISRIQR